MPKVLLTSVFKPFGVDNVFSRRESKIELFHNQLTKYQGPFSIRTHFNTFGLHAIANNLDGVPVTVLDFPTRERFQQEVAQGYDLVGIGSIMPNFQKVKALAEDIRRISPRSQIILGGFCAAVDNVKQVIPLDHVCVGEGISFMREPIRELRRQIEFEFGRSSLLERAEGWGLQWFGKARELRTRLFGDDLQPRTRLTRYPADSS